MEDSWAHRDLPVLNAIVRALEDQADVSAAQVARMTRMPGEDVVRAFRALEGTYTGHVEAVMGVGPGEVYVSRVTAAGRRATGQWPTADSLVDRLVAGLQQAADHESDPERRDRLQSVARELRGDARPALSSVVAEIIGPAIVH